MEDFKEFIENQIKERTGTISNLDPMQPNFPLIGAFGVPPIVANKAPPHNLSK
jgi:hypothetical protein